jgi:plasmid stabilization system protein ParE
MAHRVAPRAELDLDDIWFYVAKESGSIEIATRLINSITDRFVLLASFPYLGRSRDEGSLRPLKKISRARESTGRFSFLRCIAMVGTSWSAWAC